MSTYTYGAKTSSAFAVILSGVAVVGFGVWSFVGGRELRDRYSTESWGLTASKVLWVGVVILGLVIVVGGARAVALGRRQISIGSSSISIPVGWFKPEMVTLAKDQIRSLKVKDSRNQAALKLKYDDGSLMLKSGLFGSMDEFRACTIQIASFAGLPNDLPDPR